MFELQSRKFIEQFSCLNQSFIIIVILLRLHILKSYILLINFVTNFHYLSGLSMARHEAGSCEAWHTNCASCGPRAFTWQVCQPASQTNRSLAVDQKSGCTDGNVLFCALTCIHYVDIILLNLNKREKSKAKWEKIALVYKFCHCTWNYFYCTSVKQFSVHVRRCPSRKCQANVPSTSK